MSRPMAMNIIENNYLVESGASVTCNKGVEMRFITGREILDEIKEIQAMYFGDGDHGDILVACHVCFRSIQLVKLGFRCSEESCDHGFHGYNLCYCCASIKAALSES